MKKSLITLLAAGAIISVSGIFNNQVDAATVSTNHSSKAKTPFNLKPYKVPKKLVGKWYAADSKRKVFTLVFTKTSVDGHKLYKDNPKITNSSKFLKSEKRGKIYLAAKEGAFLRYGINGIDNIRVKVKGDHLLYYGNGGDLSFYKSAKKAKHNPNTNL